MGITTHAIVEQHYEQSESVRGGWGELATFYFGKAYALQRVVYALADDGWPADSSALTDPAYEFSDEGRRWCLAETALSAKWWAKLKSDRDVASWEPDEFDGMLCAIKAWTIHGKRLRVLWYTG